MGRPSSRFPQQKIQSFGVGYNSSAHPFPSGKAHGPSSTWIPLLSMGTFSPILSIMTRQATLQGATHNQGTGIGQYFLRKDCHFFSQGSPGLCEQEQHGEREEKHVLGRGTERGGALGPRMRRRAGPAPGGQEKPFPHLLSHPLGPRVPSSKSSLGKVRIRPGQGGHVWTSWASDLVCQQHDPTVRWSVSSLLGLSSLPRALWPGCRMPQ